MFVLVELRDNVKILPRLFNLNQKDALLHELHTKLANRVMYQVGLVLAVWDITKIEESYVFPGDGSTHTTVNFRALVFRPFMEEIVVGTVKNCTSEGVSVTLNFFDDIIIPPDQLQHPSEFDDTRSGEPVWLWRYKAAESVHDLMIEKGDRIRFRVVEDVWRDTLPSATDADEDAKTQPDMRPQEERVTPYTIIGTINEPGLGLLSWWTE